MKFLLLMFCVSLFADYDDINLPEKEKLYVTKFDKRFSMSKFIVYKINLSTVPNPEKEDFVVPLYFFKSRYKNPRAVVLIPPNSNGVTSLELALAGKFASRGISALVYDPQFEIQDRKRKVEELDQVFQLAIYSLKLTIDWIEQKDKYFDDEKIGVMGASMGGILSGYLVGQDSRVKSAYIYAAGGDLPSLLANSDLEYLQFLKNQWLEENEATEEDYEATLRDLISIEPSKPSVEVDPKNIFMVIGEEDQTVPAENQWHLWESLGKPPYITKGNGHAGPVFTSLKHMNKMVRFFKNSWK